MKAQRSTGLGTAAQTELPAVIGEHLPQIRSMGMMLFDPIWAERPHRASGCEILHIVRGKLRLEMPGGPFQATAGGTLLVPADTLHRDAFDLSAGLEVFFCSFSWREATAFFQRVDNLVLTRMGTHRRSELSTLFDQLRADLAGWAAVDQLIARSRLLTILLIILREANGNDSALLPARRRRADLMLEAKNYLQVNYQRCITLEDIATALGVSAYYISHVFSEESDFSLFGYLTALRMKKAKALLAEGGTKVAAVSAAVGYEDANYFTKVFKRHFGRPPRDYLTASKRSARPGAQEIP